MENQKPKPRKWQDLINDIDNAIQSTEQNLVLLKAQLEAARKQI